MSRSVASVVENNFSKGLITEASPLNFPENACTEALNVKFNQDGTVERRPGFEYEEDYTLTSITRNSSAFTEFIWENAGGNNTVSFVVQQVGDSILFFKINTSTNLSDGITSFDIDLSDYLCSGAISASGEPCEYTIGNGYLFIANKYIDPIYVSYTLETDSISVTSIVLKIRDLKGVDDDLNIDERPTVLSNTHKWNLFNQGWWGSADTQGVSGSSSSPTLTTVYQPVINYFYNAFAYYPSNAETWWQYKNEDDNMDYRQVFKNLLSSGPAAKGHYILDAFYQDRSALVTLTPNLEVESARVRPTTIAFFAGRVFYGGIHDGEYNQKIYFSQVALTTDEFERCYQANDPTDENLNELLPSDGGIIVIPELGKLNKLVAIGPSLYVFASNGIWVIESSQGSGFAANDYSVRKLSTIPSLSSLSFVIVEGAPLWWNIDGIYTLQSDQSGQAVVRSLTDDTIKTLYNQFPTQGKMFAKGAYNPVEQVIQWIFRLNNFDNVDEAYNYERLLNFNTKTGAFYLYAFEENNEVKLNGIVYLKGSGSITQDQDVTDVLGADVVDGLGATVTVDVEVYVEIEPKFKYVASTLDTGNDYYLTYAEEKDDQYLDWFLNDNVGVDVPAFFVTGYKIRGEAQKKFQTNYIIVYMEDLDDSSLFMESRWDYSNNASSGRWSQPQQVYYPRGNHYSVHRARRRIRGHGLVMQLFFYAEEGKPFKIIGWSNLDTGNNVP